MRPWLLLSAIVVAALLMAPLVAAPKPPPPPPPAPADPAVAFVNVGGLKVMNADGAATTTVYPGSTGRPSWAPDRSAIAFPLPTAFGFDLWRIDVIVSNGAVQGTNPRLLFANVSHAAVFRPAWSPDGTVIAFIEERVDTYGTWRPQLLRTIPAGGGAPTTLYAVESLDPEYALVAMLISSPAWNGAGTRIAWVENWLELESGLEAYSTWSLMVLDLATNVVTTGFGTDGYAFADLDWARTQDKIAFSVSGGIYTVDISQPNSTRQLVVGGASQPTWLPDDGKIAFQASGRQGPGKLVKGTNIWTYDFSTGKVALLGPGFAPDWVRCSPCP